MQCAFVRHSAHHVDQEKENNEDNYFDWIVKVRAIADNYQSINQHYVGKVHSNITIFAFYKILQWHSAFFFCEQEFPFEEKYKAGYKKNHQLEKAADIRRHRWKHGHELMINYSCHHKKVDHQKSYNNREEQISVN